MIQEIRRKGGEEFSGNGKDARRKESGAKGDNKGGKEGESVGGAKVFKDGKELLAVS